MASLLPSLGTHIATPPTNSEKTTEEEEAEKERREKDSADVNHKTTHRRSAINAHSMNKKRHNRMHSYFVCTHPEGLNKKYQWIFHE